MAVAHGSGSPIGRVESGYGLACGLAQGRIISAAPTAASLSGLLVGVSFRLLGVFVGPPGKQCL